MPCGGTLRTRLLGVPGRLLNRSGTPTLRMPLDRPSARQFVDSLAALERLAEFAERWEARYPAIVTLWEHAWAEFVPFLSFDPEVRAVIYTTEAREDRCSYGRRMEVTVSAMFIPVHDAGAALGFYRDALGLEVRNDVADGDLEGGPSQQMERG